MCRFVTQHNVTDVSSWGSMQLVCWLLECPPELLPDNIMFMSTISRLQQTTITIVFLSMSVWMHRDTVTRHIVVPFTRRHHLIFQHDNARPHVTRFCMQFLILVLPWPAYSQTCHPLSLFGMLRIYVYDSVFQFQPISRNFAQPLKRSGTIFHNQQPEQLYMKEMCHAAWGKWWSHQILTGFLIHASTFSKDICDQQWHICIPSHVKCID